ncbi:sodium-coupled monocarboxylate transporter 2 [Folsomia candida]|uniref:sodium-coupled monocarboxylate transporter 2 n=1 Tax=Folsomia candida TaxID=158441 RepID=UPI000B8EF1DE|nr:sodium-coupled monocarboxylate transporter 2 [Folsomia candida]
MASEVDWVDYFVFGIVLSISVGIGIFYGCFGSKQKTTKEYLLANRQMSSIPVALSMICSAVSAITLLANPVEVYKYGLQYLMVILSFVPFNLALLYLYIPVYFNLNVNSAYEFIEMRFSHGVRVFVSALAVLHVIISMAIAIYAPALAINYVTDVSVELTCFIIYFVCIFYSAIGGLKAVLWTDVFQAGVMLLSLSVIVGKGVGDVGGMSIVWERAKEGDRLGVLNFDPDPRTRHTIWTCIFAGYFFWLPSYAATQLQVQRFLSMPNMSRVKRALAINFFGLIVIVGLCFFTGLVIFAKFHDCDPLNKTGADPHVENSDQLLPLFVSETSDGIPGLLGLFIAGLTCASMSSLSSGLTALASITTYDYVNKLFPNLSDLKLSLISKVNTFVLGMVSFGFVFVIKNMGDILPVTSSFLGVILGPTLGIFSLGMFFPWANAEGATAGLVSTFAIMITFVLGTNLNSIKDQLPVQTFPLDVSGCPGSNDTMSIFSSNNGHTEWKDKEYSGLVKMLSLSYMWYSGLGCCLAVFLGLIMSLIYNQVTKRERKLINPLCISPPILNLLKKFCPDHIKNWVDISAKPTITISITNEDETVEYNKSF